MGSDLPSTTGHPAPEPRSAYIKGQDPASLAEATGAVSPPVSEDGALTALFQGPSSPSAFPLLRFVLPPNTLHGPVCGRFFMARCTDDSPDARRTDWTYYLRRPLLVAGLPSALPTGPGQRIDLLPIFPDDPGVRWLAARPFGSRVNLLGPFGQPFALPAHRRALLVLADAAWLPVWLPAIHAMLDQGGRVTLVLRGVAEPDAVLPLLPLAVELRTAADEDEWARHLGETIRWADVAVCALPAPEYQALADRFRLGRFRLERGFAYALAPADLACGFGACLACVVPLPDGGMTRACLHGPIFPLERLTTIA
ncbi:MAG TPA: hypothetical protein VNK95_11585 [Caldilineaceae bacterium]|nr:hypothetical protein [Caldilineaceae bacterium]